MKKVKYRFLAAAVFLGLVTGVLASTAYKDTEGECEKTEQAIRQKSNLSGAIACFRPGVIDVNQSDKIQKGADLQCVCRRSYKGSVELWAINRAG